MCPSLVIARPATMSIYLARKSLRDYCNVFSIPDGYLPDKVSMLGEYLHPAPLIAPVTDHILTTVLHHRNLGKRSTRSV